MVKLTPFLAKYARITIVCHPNADPDCIGSAYALQTSMKSSYPKKTVTVFAPDGVNAASVRLNEYLDFKPENVLPVKTDIYVLVDTSSLDQVPSVKESIKKERVPYAIVDHHVADKETVSGAAFSVLQQKSSACEVLFEALDKNALSKKAALALLAGLIYDSRRFLTIPDSSIMAAAKMIGLGADAALAIRLLTSEEDPSEKMAKLKGVARLRLFQAGEWLIAATNVGAYEASVARSMTNLGADLAIVINEGGEGVRLSGRSTEKFFKESGLNLAKDVMQFLAGSFNGQGGGHPTAASVNLKGRAEAVESAAMELIALKLGIRPGDIKEINTKK